MPYDLLKAQKAIRTATAYERFPGSEFIIEIAKILKDADEEIRGFNERLRAAESETRRAQLECDQARSDYKLLRETSAAHYESLLVAMKDIAGSSKGGKGKAVAALKTIGVEMPNPENPPA